jgi:hypothetical protein
MSQQETNVGTLIFPQGYLHELNQVAGVTTDSIIFLKRKFVSSSGFELVKYPLRDCFEVQYEDELPIARIIAGILVCALIVAILVFLVIYWNDLDAGTKVPIGALAFAGLYGVTLILGARRHRLKFKMNDGSTLSWKSRAGERKLMSPVVDAIVEFARSKGLLTT